jgi:hypothetical protein
MEREDYAGAFYIATTATTTGRFWALQALEATVLDGATVVDYQGSVASMPIPVGATIYGCFTTVKLISGKVLAYEA